MDGMASEAQIAKKRGARVHPRSGAGNIKWDASDEETIYEMKDAMKSHTLSGALLEKLFLDATRQGKEAVYTVYFTEFDLSCDITMHRGKE
jgi:hypothetical protein